MSDLFKLNLKDLAKGLVMAVIGAVISYFASPTLDLAAIDWNYIVKVALTVGISYLAKNLATDEQGRFLGKI